MKLDSCLNRFKQNCDSDSTYIANLFFDTEQFHCSQHTVNSKKKYLPFGNYIHCTVLYTFLMIFYLIICLLSL